MTAEAVNGSWVGKLLADRYRITDVLGVGGMATTYVAVDSNLRCLVAVKIPHANLLHREGFLKRFEREARSLVQTKHPGVVKALDVGTHLSTPYLVMEHLPGGSLADRLAKAGEPQSPEDVLAWLPDLAETLDHIHAHKLVHRDVKPGNILFDDDGRPFLADFGVAKAIDQTDTTVTHTGILPGAPAYMPPESIRGETVTGAADQYSLAMSVYEALAGRLPYGELPVVPLLMRKQSEDPTLLVAAAPDLPPEVSRVVMRALDRDAQKRFPSCVAFARAFEDALQAPQSAPWPLIAVGALTAAAAGVLLLGGEWFVLSMALLLTAGALWFATVARSHTRTEAPTAAPAVARRARRRPASP